MSVKYQPVQWNINKWVYDAVLVAGVALYVWVFLRLGAPAADQSMPTDGQVLRMRAFGTCAFLMLTVILCIGPLARLDRRFLPLLYNRRHFGVITAAVAFAHAASVWSWYYNFIPGSRLEALLTGNTTFDQVLGFPIEPFGIFALIVLFILAATSHDFWLSFLTPPVWKTLHLTIYVAYAAIVAHVALGYLQDVENPAFPVFFAGGALTVAGLHLLAWRQDVLRGRREGEWVDVGPPEMVEEGLGRVVRLPDGKRAAIFRHRGRLSAVSNACAHQNGPLGEGRVVDGCITCPWHGFQYRPADGVAPPPFTEKIPTYRLRLREGRVQIDPRANPPGTYVEPLDVTDIQSAEAASVGADGAPA